MARKKDLRKSKFTPFQVRIIKSLENPNYKWRTIEKVAEENKIRPEIVEKNILELKKLGLIAVAEIPKSDKKVYSTIKHYRKKHSFIHRFIDVGIGEYTIWVYLSVVVYYLVF